MDIGRVCNAAWSSNFGYFGNNIQLSIGIAITFTHSFLFSRALILGINKYSDAVFGQYLVYTTLDGRFRCNFHSRTVNCA